MGTDPDIAAIATTAAFGASAAGVLAIPKQMARSEVIYRIAIASILSATVPQVLLRYSGLDPVVTWLLGVLCGISAPEIIMQLQSFTTAWLKRKTDELNGGNDKNPPTGGGV